MEKELEDFLKARKLDAVIATARTPLLDDHEIKRVEIIVLKYKSPDIEIECLSRIIRYTQWPYKLNVFDNRGNGPNTSKAWNKLIKESTCDYILFMDSDAFVMDSVGTINGNRPEKGVCWLTEMMKPFEICDNVAIVGPVCGTAGVTTIQSMKPKDDAPMEFDGHISGYCFLVKKSIYEELGLFDEDFCFYGQESDWIEKILEGKNKKIFIIPRAHVIHGFEGVGSLSAQQAEREDGFSPGADAEYSMWTWKWKKSKRTGQPV